MAEPILDFEINIYIIEDAWEETTVAQSSRRKHIVTQNGALVETGEGQTVQYVRLRQDR